jgi:hypothetical protein
MYFSIAGLTGANRMGFEAVGDSISMIAPQETNRNGNCPLKLDSTWIPQANCRIQVQ